MQMATRLTTLGEMLLEEGEEESVEKERGKTAGFEEKPYVVLMYDAVKRFEQRHYALAFGEDYLG